MRLWFSEMLMGGITQALFTRRDPSWCRQPGGLPRAALASCRGGTLGKKKSYVFAWVRNTGLGVREVWGLQRG